MPRQAKLKRIWVAISIRRGDQRAMIEGIIRYARGRPDWELVHDRDVEPRPDSVRIHSHADATIAESFNADVIEALKHAGKPLVAIPGPTADPDIPCVCVRQDASFLAGLAYLEGLGFRKLSFYGDSKYPVSDSRESQFRSLVASRGHLTYLPCPLVRSALRGAELDEALAAWVASLPPGVAVQTANVVSGQSLTLAAHSAGRSVPDELAILTLGPDPLQCELSSPPLSTIDGGHERIGYEGARLLDGLMQGLSPDWPVYVDPKGVIPRRSTDTLVVDQPQLAQALRFVRDYACDGIDVSDVLAEVALSRSSLERGFNALLGRSVYAEIIRLRVQAAQKMLLETDLPIVDVAHRCGFGHRTRMHAAFRKLPGATPAQYRRDHR